MLRSVIYEFALKQFIITDRSADQLNDKETKKSCMLGNNSSSLHRMKTNELSEKIFSLKKKVFLLKNCNAKKVIDMEVYTSVIA